MTTTAALIAVIVLLSIGWLAAEIRYASERAISARQSETINENVKELAELRATKAAREEWARQLRHEVTAHVSPVLQRAGEHNDRLPGLIARLAGERYGVHDSEPRIR